MDPSRAIEGPLFEIRGAMPEDEEQILSIARHLNTVNLPDQREGVRQILELTSEELHPSASKTRSADSTSSCSSIGRRTSSSARR